MTHHSSTAVGGRILSLTMTMTHSDEVTNGSRKPGPTDVGAGVTTQKESLESVRLAQEARRTLGALYKTVHGVTSREKKKTNRRMLDKFI